MTLKGRVAYSRAERISDAVIHVVGLFCAALGVPALIAFAAVVGGDVSTISAVAIYGACLVAMLLCSALYNMVPEGRWSGLLQRLDHSAIYFKIAGTYTPFTLLGGTAGVGLLAGVWSAALAGTSLKVLAPHRTRWLCLALYLGMGWAGLVVGRSMFEALSPDVFALMLAGGFIYTAGVGFHLFDRLPFHNTIWHAFVLVATVFFYAAVTVQLIETTLPA